MFIEFHIIQNFAPSNLNRDDTGAPKDCEFGGYRRARISSQCLKRAMRSTLQDRPDLVSPSNLALRTKRLVNELLDRLTQGGKDAEEAGPVVEAALGGLGLAIADKQKTEYLLYLGADEVTALATAIEANWVALRSATLDAAEAPGKKAKKTKKEAIPREVVHALDACLEGSRALDLALFGRMIADRPEKNTDAASQIAHALSTHRATMEFDFYTAVDDLRPEASEGADMMGTVEFNSACFYRYGNVDLTQLARNLGGDEDLARGALRAFLTAAVEAVPTGKQNSMAAHNPPAFVMVVPRERGLWNLANAFLDPVRPRADGNLVAKSVDALGYHWDALTSMYGRPAGQGPWFAMVGDSPGTLSASAERVTSVGDVIDRAVGSGRFGS